MSLPSRITFVPGRPLGPDARTFPAIDLGGRRPIIINEPSAPLETHDAIARRLAACWNACVGLDTDLLVSITDQGQTLAERFALRDLDERELRALLYEVRQCFTRDDVLPNNLLGRIDDAL